MCVSVHVLISTVSSCDNFLLVCCARDLPCTEILTRYRLCDDTHLVLHLVDVSSMVSHIQAECALEQECVGGSVCSREYV